jgi:hypothetical protein
LVSEWELWACAAEVEREHGSQAAVFIAARLETLALKGDIAGVTTWKAIARRLGQLRSPAASLEQ